MPLALDGESARRIDLAERAQGGSHILTRIVRHTLQASACAPRLACSKVQLVYSRPAHLLIHVFEYQSLHCFRLQTAQHLPKSFGQILGHESRAIALAASPCSHASAKA